MNTSFLDLMGNDINSYDKEVFETESGKGKIQKTKVIRDTSIKFKKGGSDRYLDKILNPIEVNM